MPNPSPKLRFLLFNGLVLGILLSLMAWSRYRFVVIDNAFELYMVLIAVVFVSIGIWAGLRWSAPRAANRYEPVPAPVPVNSYLSINEVLEKYGISTRELDVLIQVAKGMTNDEIAEHLFVSTNTVKTHLANLYTKLDVKRRTQAVEKARSLGLIS